MTIVLGTLVIIYTLLASGSMAYVIYRPGNLEDVVLGMPPKPSFQNLRIALGFFQGANGIPVRILSPNEAMGLLTHVFSTQSPMVRQYPNPYGNN